MRLRAVNTMVPVRSGDLRRFLSTYRWEVWFFLGVPVIIGAVRQLVRWLVHFDSNTWYHGSDLAIGALGLALLAAAFPLVRRRGRQLLILLWALELVTRGASIALKGFDLTRGEQPAGIQLFTIHTVGDLHYFSTVSAWVGVIALVWFARQASRISTAHAFLLVGLSFATPSFSLQSFVFQSLSGYVGLFAAIYLISTIAVNILALWTMVHFESRGVAFRRVAIAGLFGMALWSSFFGIYAYFPVLAVVQGYRLLEQLFEDWSAIGMEMLGLALLFGLYNLLPLPLIYLVRVRRRPVENVGYEQTVRQP